MVFAFSEKYDSPARPDDSRAHPDLAVVIPAWNERENIELLLPALREVIAGLGLTAEIVVADGGSRDGTAEAAQRRGGRAGPGERGCVRNAARARRVGHP